MTTDEEIRAEANKDATVSPKRYTVLYGDTGKRKTTTAVSMIKERGLILSTDGSWKVLLNPRHKDIYSNVKKIIDLDGLSQLKYIDFSDYDTIIWDTVNGSVDSYLDMLYDEGVWRDKSGKIMFRETITTNNTELKEVSILAPMDYRVTRDIFRPTFSRLIHETDAHIIFTSHAKEPIVGLNKDMTIKPDIPAATFKILARYADLIVNIRPETRKFVADLSENSSTYLAKSRIEGLQGKMDLDAFVTTYKEIVF